VVVFTSLTIRAVEHRGIRENSRRHRGHLIGDEETPA
jgi:hypothetical protein